MPVGRRLQLDHAGSGDDAAITAACPCQMLGLRFRDLRLARAVER
jgi:hypothetical protein